MVHEAEPYGPTFHSLCSLNPAQRDSYAHRTITPSDGYLREVTFPLRFVEHLGPTLQRRDPRRGHPSLAASFLPPDANIFRLVIAPTLIGTHRLSARASSKSQQCGR